MATNQVESKGIYHGLPVYKDSVRGLRAIVTGSNGISGNAMIKVLAQAPHRWSKIYCLSRRPPTMPDGFLPEQAEHISLDFLAPPEETAEVLRNKGVDAYVQPNTWRLDRLGGGAHANLGCCRDYVFFFSYIQTKSKTGQGTLSDAENLCRANDAMRLASIKPKRIMLQTGAKYYGVHLGPSKLPQSESDPRVDLEPNFYYQQMDELVAHCKENSIGWTEVRPSFILGAVPDAAMNLVLSLGIYASICKHTGRRLEWHGTMEAWEMHQDQSAGMLNAYLEEWSVLADNTANQTFNVCDGSAFCWGHFWPKLAGWYGIEYGTPEVDAQYFTQDLGYEPPPRGFGHRAQVKARYTLREWGKQAEIIEAWKELNQKYELQGNEVPDPDKVLAFADHAVLGGTKIHFSMDKARAYGFFGTVDSSEVMLQVLRDFVKLKMLPPIFESATL